jgi:DNA adenine methylase
LATVEEGDFVYLDPPYAPENETSFVGYTENGFGLEKHKTLFEMVHVLTSDPNKKVMMSNADVMLVRENFTNNDIYHISSILCKRTIHSKNPDAKAKELIIKNYYL